MAELFEVEADLAGIGATWMLVTERVEPAGRDWLLTLNGPQQSFRRDPARFGDAAATPSRYLSN